MTNATGTRKKAAKKTKYDSAWKEVIEKLFEQFLEFFFPEIHQDIDFSKNPEFLSKELTKIFPDGNTGNRYADELVKVYLKNGSEACLCIFIHVEVQGTKDTDFSLRMYVYNYRIFDRYRDQGVEVISLAILTDNDENYRPDEYLVNHWGFEHRMKIPLVKIIDYQNVPEKKELMVKSDNPMAIVVKAQLKSSEARKGDNSRKFDVKRELIRMCYKQGYARKQIRVLLKFIDWVIRLPEDLENRLTQEISKIEEGYKMPYVTSWERLGEKKGRKEGIKEGIKEGKIETAKRMLMDGLSIDTISRYTGLLEKEIKAIMN